MLPPYMYVHQVGNFFLLELRESERVSERKNTERIDVERKRYRVPNKSNPQTLCRRMNGTKQAKNNKRNETKTKQ